VRLLTSGVVVTVVVEVLEDVDVEPEVVVVVTTGFVVVVVFEGSALTILPLEVFPPSRLLPSEAA
jgi:hypothetical protein